MMSGNGNTRSIPVVNLPYFFVSGMNLSVASTTELAIAPGSCRDSSNSLDIDLFAPLFLNPSKVGAGGIDAGTIAASTQYAIYAIADSHGRHPNSGLFSLTSNFLPTLPLGYDSWRLLGFGTTDSSSHWVAADMLNTSTSRGFYLQPAISVLSGGNATTFTAMNLSAAVPADPNTIVLLNIVFTPAAANDFLQLRPTGSSATTNLATVQGQSAGVPVSITIPVICGISGGNAEIDYKVSSSSDSVNITVAGYYSTLS